jgi:IS30 family transposase
LSKCPELREYIEAQILEKRHTPDIVVGRMRLEGIQLGTTVCTKTVYNAIDAGVFENLTNKYLPVKSNPAKNKHRTVRISHKNLKGTSIDDRPPEIDEREEYGHWEMDLVLSGKGHRAALLTLTERLSREEIIVKIWDKSQKSVQKAMDGLEKALGSVTFRTKFRTITIDNGSEFLDFKGLEASIDKGPARTKVYYAHPYSAWERGSNENHNGMIRRKIPKGSNIGVYSAKRVKEVQDWMNNYPRRILGYMTPNEVARRAMAKVS